MKKLNKTQKQLIKKRLLKALNIIALIIGGLSFAFVLYALVFGGSSNEQGEVDYTPTPKINKALTPPSSYDLSLSPVMVGPHYYHFWHYSTTPVDALFTKTISTIDYYTNTTTFRGMTITTDVYAPTTPIETRDNKYVFRGEYFGSVASTPTFRRFRIILDNRDNMRSFLFYADFSSSGDNRAANSYLYDNDNNYIGITSNFVSYYMEALRGCYVPPYSRIELLFHETTGNHYLDALYIKDLDATAYFEGYDAGILDGYPDGFDDGYIDGTQDGYDFGYQEGYYDGIEAEQIANGGFQSAFDLIYSGAESVDKILSISVFGNVTIGLLIFVPLIFTIILTVVKVIKG